MVTLQILLYAHMLIVVAFLVVKQISFLVITRSHELRIGRNLVEIHPTGPPELPIQLRDLDNNQRTQKFDIQLFRKIETPI